MNKKKGIISLICTSSADRTSWLYDSCRIWQKDRQGQRRILNLGLDLAGGVSITYQVKDENPIG